MSRAVDISSPHRRYNPLTGEWVLVSPHRTKRPWLGGHEKIAERTSSHYLRDCYLCPSNARSSGEVNPNYVGPFAFENDFAALLQDATDADSNDDLFKVESSSGRCRVICFSPQHNLTLPDMKLDDIEQVVKIWMEETQALGEDYQWVQIFENKGSIMGCSNEHPHGQIWASKALPTIPLKEDVHQSDYSAHHAKPMLVEYLDRELENGERVVTQNSDWAVVVPYWAVWPYEILLLPKRHIKRLTDISISEVSSLATIMQLTLKTYDRIFETSFPYTMGWHGAPFDADSSDHWQLHAHAYPPLLRSATVKKFMVGYEMLAEPQRDITAEQAAETLRSLI